MGYLYLYMKLLDIIFESVVDMNEAGGRKLMTKDEFVRRSKEVHGDKYTYDNVVMNGLNKTVNITCPLHGDFPQTPNNHLAGKEGCKKCDSIRRKSNAKEFIQKAQKIHFLYDDDGKKIPKYTYDNVIYGGSFVNVMITCPIHGDFPQYPSNHLQGAGCDKCAINASKSNTKEFIQNAQATKEHQHKDGTPKYTYDNVIYVNGKIKVMITCPIHSPTRGDFPQTPNSHLNGRGCPWCKESKGEKTIGRVLFEKNIKLIPFKKYDDCISYKSKKGISKKGCRKLTFDFYLPDQNTLIEFDGAYHFRKSRISQDYITQVFNDREKNEYTKAKNIKLIRIGYLDKENIEEELMKGLDSNDQLYLSTKYPIDKGWRDTTIKV